MPAQRICNIYLASLRLCRLPRPLRGLKKHKTTKTINRIMQHFNPILIDIHSVRSQIVAQMVVGILAIFLKKYQKLSTYMNSRKPIVESHKSENQPPQIVQGEQKPSKKVLNDNK